MAGVSGNDARDEAHGDAVVTAIPKTVAEEWAYFEHKVLMGVGDIQRTEMRRAFYVGYQQAINATAALGEDAVSMDEGVKFLEARMAELAAFGEAIQAGKA